MIFSSQPVRSLKGELFLPASKSYSIRAFIIAACGGKSCIVSPSNCDDAKVAMAAAQALGAKVTPVARDSWSVIAGQSPRLKTFQVGESGTVLRFVLPLLSLSGNKVVVKGKGTLVGRPNFHLTEMLRNHGVDIHGQGKEESVPIRIRGGKLIPGRMSIDGTLSSQFISSLLIACPQLKAATRLRITGKKMVSGDYIEMTQRVLSLAGIKIVRKGPREFLIPGNQRAKGLKKFIVPSDFGLAAFLLALGILVPSQITLRGCLRRDLVQADGRIFLILKKMGVKLRMTATAIHLHGPFELKGGDFSLEAAPDLVPILAILALFSKGRTRIYNIRHARAKESDRISDLRQELLKIGAKVEEKENELLIYPQMAYKPNVLLDPHRDHRLAMAFAVLGVKIAVRIKDIECVAKSYPDFLKDFRKLGAQGRLS